MEATGGAAADSVRVEATLGGKRVGVRRLALRSGSRAAGAGAARGGRAAASTSLRVTPAAGRSRGRRRGAAHRHPAPHRHGGADAGRRAAGGPGGLGQPLSLSHPAGRGPAAGARVRPRGPRAVALDGRSRRWCRRRRCAQAARRADLLIRMGPLGAVGGRTRRARGIWRWGGGSDSTALPGDWYLRPGDASPVAGAFLGEPVDSFPPAIQTHAAAARAGRLGGAHARSSAAAARRARRCSAARPGASRRVTVAVDGLWRWAFRGGTQRAELPHLGRRHGELAAGRRRLGPRQRPPRAGGRGERAAGDVRVDGAGAADGRGAWPGAASAARGADTLRFDGSGRATVWLAPGRVPLPLVGRRRRARSRSRSTRTSCCRRPVTLAAHDARAPGGVEPPGGARLALALRPLRPGPRRRVVRATTAGAALETGVGFSMANGRLSGQEGGPLGPHQARRAHGRGRAHARAQRRTTWRRWSAS